jgi:hypothetical protein
MAYDVGVDAGRPRLAYSRSEEIQNHMIRYDVFTLVSSWSWCMHVLSFLIYLCSLSWGMVFCWGGEQLNGWCPAPRCTRRADRCQVSPRRAWRPTSTVRITWSGSRLRGIKSHVNSLWCGSRQSSTTNSLLLSKAHFDGANHMVRFTSGRESNHM